MSANAHPDDVDDLQPEKDEVLQQEDYPPSESVPVRLEGIARTQELPHKGGTTFTRTVTATVPVRLLAADHRRSVARVVSIGANALFALRASDAGEASRMSQHPQNVVYTLTADCELWVMAATGTTSVSVTTELWAEGNSKA
jgi:hypothetical protein